MRQFEVWWANSPAPAGRRLVLLLSRNGTYQYLSKFIVAEITTTIRAIPVRGLYGSSRKTAIALCRKTTAKLAHVA